MTRARFVTAVATVAAVAVLAGTLVSSARLQALDRDGDNQSAAAIQSAAAPQKPGGKNQRLVPDPVKSSTLRVRLDFAGHMPSGTNATSPAIAGSQLLLIDQGGNLYAWDGTSSRVLLSSAGFPAELSRISSEALQNVAADATGTTVYVTFTSSTVPTGIPVSESPRTEANAWLVLYQYSFDGWALANPRAITALEVRTDNHTSGGLIVLGDGTLLFSTGDNGSPGEDGLDHPQDIDMHLGKILRINTIDGSIQPVALGVRNVQRLAIDPNGGDPHLVFADIGGWVAEEVNAIRLTDLLAGGSTRNFGWGKHLVDRKAREGTFYIDPAGTAVGVVPSLEAGFVKPLAQVGRQSASAIGVSGPVISPQSFSRIRALFGDLVSGSVYAVTGAPSSTGQAVFKVALVDHNLQTVTLKGLAGGNRPDPRFFNFPNGTAGVLLEHSGDFYRLTEVR